MPSLDFDWEENGENENENSIVTNNVKYSHYKNTIDRTITETKFNQMKSKFSSSPYVSPHLIHQDFYNNGKKINVQTTIYLSLDKQSILKYIEI